MKTRDWSLIRVTCGDHSIRYRERTVTSGLCLRWVGPPSCPGPVRVCLGKERGRKKDRKGVRKDIPMSPLHIQHQGLIWNEHGRSQRRERECLKKKKSCAERVNFHWNCVRVQRICSHSDVELLLAQLWLINTLIQTLQHQNPGPEENPGPILHRPKHSWKSWV